MRLTNYLGRRGASFDIDPRGVCLRPIAGRNFRMRPFAKPMFQDETILFTPSEAALQLGCDGYQATNRPSRMSQRNAFMNGSADALPAPGRHCRSSHVRSTPIPC